MGDHFASCRSGCPGGSSPPPPGRHPTVEAVASKKLAELKKGGVDEDEYLSPEFYESKVATSQYVFDALLPRTRSLARQMFTPIESIMQMDKDHFSFDHAQ